MENYSQELAVALDSVRQAARLCQTVQSRITTEALEKKDRSPVTIADFGSQAVICRALKNAFPGDPIIGEEDADELGTGAQSGFLDQVCGEVRDVGIDASAEQVCDWIDHGGHQHYAERFWTLDPIDGTKGFLRGEQYAISLCLIVDGRLQLGVLGCPNLPVSADGPAGTLLYAVNGIGSHQQPLDDASPAVPIQVSDTTDSKQARFCESVESGHSRHDQSATVAERLGITEPAVRLDSQAKYAVVARGEADIYLRLPTRKDYDERIWDHAAGVLMVEAAGGTVTDLAGQPLDWTQGSTLKANRGVIVSNGPLHGALLDALAVAGVR